MQIGFCGVLAIIFITLKLLGIIAWSWLWVLAPLWVPFAIAAVIFLVTLTIGVAVTKRALR
jgi:CHASE2 domain-containing sensor protein